MRALTTQDCIEISGAKRDISEIVYTGARNACVVASVEAYALLKSNAAGISNASLQQIAHVAGLSAGLYFITYVGSSIYYESVAA